MAILIGLVTDDAFIDRESEHAKQRNAIFIARDRTALWFEVRR
jgi:hypothetical protein